MKGIRWAQQALTDLERIHDHYAETAPHFPPALLERIDRLARVLLVFPNLAPAVGGTAIRKIRIGGTNFILFYQPTQDGIVIARLFHAKQDWRGP